MLNKFETTGVAISISLMIFALFILNGNFGVSTVTDSEVQNVAAVVVAGEETTDLSDALNDSVDGKGNVQNLIIDDITVGFGDEVKVGDVISVNYIGTLQNGQQFDNSYIKGTPFEFTVGEGKVIAGWDQGVIGMKVGGQRILVIPPTLAYGANGAGPIPKNATLVFAIELLDIN